MFFSECVVDLKLMNFTELNSLISEKLGCNSDDYLPTSPPNTFSPITTSTLRSKKDGGGVIVLLDDDKSERRNHRRVS